jgi:hypothetical protein
MARVSRSALSITGLRLRKPGPKNQKCRLSAAIGTISFSRCNVNKTAPLADAASLYSGIFSLQQALLQK